MEANHEKLLTKDRFSILVIDDNDICLKIVEKLLTHCKYEGTLFFITLKIALLKMTSCDSAEEAFSILREDKNRFDLVLSDLHMPNMNGIDLLKLMKGLEIDLPVVIMSDSKRKNDIEEGMVHGASDYLIKPLQLQDMQMLWKHIVSRKHRKNPKAYSKEEIPNANHIRDRDLPSKKRKICLKLVGEKDEWNLKEEIPIRDCDLPSKKRKMFLILVGKEDEGNLKEEIPNDNHVRDCDLPSKKRKMFLKLVGEEHKGNSNEEIPNDNGYRISEMPKEKASMKMHGVKTWTTTHRFIWTRELHNKFIAAVKEIGYEKATPKQILKVMNVKNITREIVASHLQKYRMYINESRRKKLLKEGESSVMQANMPPLQTVPFVGGQSTNRASNSFINLQNMGIYPQADSSSQHNEVHYLAGSTSISQLLGKHYPIPFDPSGIGIIPNPYSASVVRLSSTLGVSPVMANNSGQNVQQLVGSNRTEPNPYPMSITQLSNFGGSPVILTNNSRQNYQMSWWWPIATPVSGTGTGMRMSNADSTNKSDHKAPESE
ncbi:hypothetical protein ACFE04_014210 [Oxalis oulophora]